MLSTGLIMLIAWGNICSLSTKRKYTTCLPTIRIIYQRKKNKSLIRKTPNGQTFSGIEYSIIFTSSVYLLKKGCTFLGQPFRI